MEQSDRDSQDLVGCRPRRRAVGSVHLELCFFFQAEDGIRGLVRSRGLGRRLLRAGLTRLCAHGAAVAKLEVREGNAVARSLYASEGFEPIRRARRYYRDGEDALVLAVDLGTWASDSAVDKA